MAPISRAALLSLTTAALLTVSAQAAPLSPALQLVAAKETMHKHGNIHTGVTFTAQDFRTSLSLDEFSGITITSLPSPAAGALYVGDVPLAVNQSISAGSLSALRFVPAKDSRGGSFTFTSGGEYALVCEMQISDEVNFAPVAVVKEDTAAWTRRDIRCVGTLSAYDPEGDAMVYEIVRYPEKGLLTLTSPSHGDFAYTPYVGCSGTDTFTYRVRDSYGNYSAEAMATIQIDRDQNVRSLSDMEGHWAHSASLEMVERGIMDAAVESGMALFYPDREVTREEFLTMVMRSLGYEEEADVQTVFADNDAISPEARAAVSAAYHAGIIRGREAGGVRVFCPDEPITRSECAVMLNNIIGAEVPVNVSLFSDNADVPVWAQSALYALCDLGLIRGTGGGEIAPDTVITRAQAAQLLTDFTRYVG